MSSNDDYRHHGPVVVVEYEDKIVVTRFAASVPGIPFSAEGDTELAALKNLIDILANNYRKEHVEV